MSTEKDPQEELFPQGISLYPEIDLEEPIMAAVRQQAAVTKRVRRLRRNGLISLTIFLVLLALALWFSQLGYSHPAYASPLTNYGFAGLLTLVLFVQLEVWWKKPKPLT